ncbi:MAG: hypothetical protein OJF49_001630 [Ktedonobacterales bacterium]|jgi:uncharacterized protein (UPF0210 family)|nr:MAG: hypothetical protein OJF49_001630 [Ktedonobacterales bacterium]
MVTSAEATTALARTIRTITLGIAERHPLDERTVARAGTFLREAQAAAEVAGYSVQTTRIATRPLLADMGERTDAEIVAYVAALQGYCDVHGITFCSLGPVPADDPVFATERIALLPELLLPHEAMSATVQLASLAHGVRYAAALPTARVIRALAEGGVNGEANFRFAALACCEPGGPFFPQAYHLGAEWSVTLGMQTAGLVRETIAGLAARVGPGLATLDGVEAEVRAALLAAVAPASVVASEVCGRAGYRFAGVDLSPAPLGNESMAAAIEAVGLGPFGGPGTLAVSAALTAAIKSVPVESVGYCGLMLPVLEDRVLGERCAEGHVSVAALLAYSAVCGTGLDTVPLPGDAPEERIAALLADVAALAARLRKPLSARLFLVPGGQVGDMTRFTSPYLTNTRVMAL